MKNGWIPVFLICKTYRRSKREIRYEQGLMVAEHLKRHIITPDGLEGDLVIPSGARAIVLFSHGSGSTRLSSRNQFVAAVLNNKNNIATLLVDLLKPDEKNIDEETNHFRYDVDLLCKRVELVTSWLGQDPETMRLSIGCFGSSIGAAAALTASVRLGLIKAIVARGGRLDLVDETTLNQVKAPTLFIVGSNDVPIISANARAFKSLSSAEAKQLVVVPNATHLFQEAGKMEEVARIASDWFECYLLKSGMMFHSRYAGVTRSKFLSVLPRRLAFQIKFRDRFAAGELLASLLSRHKKEDDDIVVIGIARGGIIVADPVTEKLNADFDIIVPRKLRSPHNSEHAIGSIMHDQSVYLDIPTLATQQDISEECIEVEKVEQKTEIEHRLTLYRPSQKAYKIRHKTVILVDDGIATGATMIASARWTRKQNPKRLIITAPVGPKQVVRRLNSEADQIEVLRQPSQFKSVSQFYQQFMTVSDDAILQVAKRHFLS
jgi:putative phosphoribosyl transferase